MIPNPIRMYAPIADLDFITSPPYDKFHPPTQETTALAVEECVHARHTISTINVSCFGGFRSLADDPPKPWRLRAEALQRPGA